MRKILQIVFLLVIVALVMGVYYSIMSPIRFEREKKFRESLNIQNLKDIRNAEAAYRMVNRKYTASFDTLISFIKYGTVPVIKMVPDPKDTTFSKSILDTIGYVSVMDTLFKNRTKFNPDYIKYIPMKDENGGFIASSNCEIYKLEAGYTEKSKIRIPVLKVSALNTQILKGMNEQSIYNINEKLKVNDLFPGLFFGSMTEATVDGNWE